MLGGDGGGGGWLRVLKRLSPSSLGSFLSRLCVRVWTDISQPLQPRNSTRVPDGHAVLIDACLDEEGGDVWYRIHHAQEAG